MHKFTLELEKNLTERYQGSSPQARRRTAMTMDRLQRAAIICRLTEKLREGGSWCGETHIQKAAFLLGDGRHVPLGWRFVLYKYGPFSFDLREELGELRAEDFLRLEPPPSGYGPPLEVDQRGRKVMEQFNDTIDQHEGAVADVVEFVGTRGVSGLERLATAVYLVLHKETREDEDLARELCDIKAHVSEAGAREAVAPGREFLSGSGVPS
jgi:hypothetical protein